MKRFQKEDGLPILAHIIAWGIIFAFPFIAHSKEGETYNLQRYWGYISVPIASVLIFYINYFWLIDKLLFRKKVLYFVLVNLGMIGVICLGVQAWQSYYYTNFIAHLLNKPPRPPHNWFYIRDMSFLLLVGGLSVAIKMTSNWLVTENERRELEKGRAEAELKNLKNQLNPHFLFNTLNNIYSLISFNPETAQHAVHDLSRLLRYVLYEDNQHTVPIMKEVDFVNNYIALMKIRLPEHVEVNIHIFIQNNVDVAPLLFITLVENAFKHGVSPVKPSFIKIDLKTEKDNTIICRIENSYFPKTETDKSGSGIGLENLEKRLSLLYPNHHTLSIEREGDLFIADLRINATKNL